MPETIIVSGMTGRPDVGDNAGGRPGRGSERQVRGSTPTMNERTGSSTNRASAAGHQRAPREARDREAEGLLARLAEEARRH